MESPQAVFYGENMQVPGGVLHKAKLNFALLNLTTVQGVCYNRL
jgi:hypothetical protein